MRRGEINLDKNVIGGTGEGHVYEITDLFCNSKIALGFRQLKTRPENTRIRVQFSNRKLATSEIRSKLQSLDYEYRIRNNEIGCHFSKLVDSDDLDEELKAVRKVLKDYYEH